MVIASKGGIEPLIVLLMNRTEEGKTKATLALARLAVNYDSCQMAGTIASNGGIEPLILLVRNGTADGKTAAACALKNLANIGSIHSNTIIDGGAIGALLALLRDGNAAGTKMAASTLLSLASQKPVKDRILREGLLIIEDALQEPNNTSVRRQIEELLKKLRQ